MTIDRFTETIQEIFSHFNIGLPSGQMSYSSTYKCVCHDVFQIRTQEKTYFLKRLNPIMLRNPTELLYHNNSQEIALLNYNRGIESVLAYRDSLNKAVYSLRGDYYMLYPWIDAKGKKIAHYSFHNYYQIGELLGSIHNNSAGVQPRQIFRHPQYETLGEADFRMAFQENAFLKIMEIYWRAVDAFSHSESDVLSHCDITPKNLLWKNEKLIIVDWDAAGWINEEREIQQTIFSFIKEVVAARRLEIVKSILMGYLSKRKYRCLDFDKAFFSSLLEDFESIKNCATEKYGTCFYSKKNIGIVTEDLLCHLSIYGIIKKAFSELSII